MSKLRKSGYMVGLLLAATYPAISDDVYVQTNLTSDISTLAPNTDPNLKNPWGISFSNTSPFWVSNAASNTSTLYGATGAPAGGPLIVNVAGGPTGQVSASTDTTTTDFPVTTATGTAKAGFIFDTIGGTIQGWTGGLTTAVVEVSKPGAIYTGLAIDTAGASTFIYAANFSQNSIDVYNGSWTPVTLSANAFKDPNVPTGYAPYNIQNINGNLYVEYAMPLNGGAGGQAVRGAGLGYVDVYDASGNLISHLVSAVSQINAPWGVTLAPAGFGSFANDLLVGNFGNGQINAFNPSTGAFLGTIDGPNGSPIVNNNLWGIAFRSSTSGFDPNALFFTAGINGQADGLFGEIAVAPEPGTFALLAGAAILFAARRVRRA